MLSDDEIVFKFKQGLTISSLVDFIILKERSDNAIRAKQDKVKISKLKARQIVENAIYQNMMRRD